MAEPIGPPPEESQDDVLKIISDVFGAARRARENVDFTTSFRDALTEIDDRRAPDQLPMPGLTSPIGRMAATFSALMSDQLLRRQHLGPAISAKFRDQETAKATTEQENIRQRRSFEMQKERDRLTVLLQIGEAKEKMLKEGIDLDEYEAKVKANYTIQQKLKKLAEDEKKVRMEVRHGQIMNEIKARGEQARTTLNYRKLLKQSEESKKTSEGLKTWLRAKLSMLERKTITGEPEFTVDEQEQMAQDFYEEFLEKDAAEKSEATETPSTERKSIFDIE